MWKVCKEGHGSEMIECSFQDLRIMDTYHDFIDRISETYRSKEQQAYWVVYWVF